MQYSFALGLVAVVAKTTASLSTNRAEATLYGALLPRQDNDAEDYIASVCTPNITSPVPPCQAIIDIEEACQPNGTEAIDYIAHQECMCNGGFFSNWYGCLNCQYVHGARSEAVVDAFSAIISSASVSLCTGTPTASFAAIFASISDSAPQVVSGAATIASDQYPSNAAVSLYYTATGPQGAGAITGSATEATRSLSSASAASSKATGSATAALSASRTQASSTKVSASSSGTGTHASTSTSAGSGSRIGSAAPTTTSATQTGAASGVKVCGTLVSMTILVLAVLL